MTDEIGRLGLQAEELRIQMTGLNTLADSFGVKMVNAFAGAIVHGRKFSDMLKGLALSLAQSALTQGLRPLGNLLGGLLGGVTANAKGNVISAGRITAFADGGIVNSPTLFPMRGGAGLMGEAGPEAIMPLARGADGRLGVRGGGNTTVNVHITTPDAESFRQSQSQVAALMARAVSRGQRNL